MTATNLLQHETSVEPRENSRMEYKLKMSIIEHQHKLQPLHVQKRSKTWDRRRQPPIPRTYTQIDTWEVQFATTSRA